MNLHSQLKQNKQQPKKRKIKKDTKWSGRNFQAFLTMQNNCLKPAHLSLCCNFVWFCFVLIRRERREDADKKKKKKKKNDNKRIQPQQQNYV